MYRKCAWCGDRLSSTTRNAIRRAFLAPRKLVPPRVCVNQAAITQLSRAERDFRVAGSRPLIMRPNENARGAQSRGNDSAIPETGPSGSWTTTRRYPDFFAAHFNSDPSDGILLETKNKMEKCRKQNKLQSVQLIFVSHRVQSRYKI